MGDVPQTRVLLAMGITMATTMVALHLQAVVATTVAEEMAARGLIVTDRL
jgi:hypothetical protein